MGLTVPVLTRFGQSSTNHDMRIILRIGTAPFVAAFLLGVCAGVQAQGVRPGTVVVPPRPPLEKACPAALSGPPFQTGEASHYASRFHGRRTAFGDVYDSTYLTAAHRSLKNGQKILVRNVRNGKSVVVRVNDRGPFAGTRRGRVVDLSERAAEILGFHGGLTQVEIYRCGE